ncbi:MAG: acyltransferase [Thermoleophilia bacterium]
MGIAGVGLRRWEIQAPGATSRRGERLTRYPSGDANSMWGWRRQVPLRRVARNFVVIYACRYLPSLPLKNLLYRSLGVRVGRRTAAGLGATLDIFFPQLITVGDDTIIGYNTVILAHEFLRRELRTGPVVIGRDVMIGANCTILPGVVIGDGAVVSAHSLVNDDVPPGAVVGGVPARPLSGGGGSPGLISS